MRMPRNFRVIFVIIFEVNIIAKQKQALMVTTFFVLLSFHCPQLFYYPLPYHCSDVTLYLMSV